MNTTSLRRLVLLIALLPLAAAHTHAAECSKDRVCGCQADRKAACTRNEKTNACAEACTAKDAGQAACADCKCGADCKPEAKAGAEAGACAEACKKS